MVDVGREIVELETTVKGQEELLLQLSPKQQQQLQPPMAPTSVWMSQLVIPLLETGSKRLHSSSRISRSSPSSSVNCSSSSRKRKMGW